MTPNLCSSEYYNYKGFFSITLFAMVTYDYKFLWVDVSGDGSSSDAQIYNSELREGLEQNIMGWLIAVQDLDNNNTVAIIATSDKCLQHLYLVTIRCTYMVYTMMDVHFVGITWIRFMMGYLNCVPLGSATSHCTH